ncbi:MAG: tRNA pseudouridine(38-40) synthase TruA [Flavobacteriaceae bacterium]|nr:tRNA pseudouridine(38-40) synthase TruA [Flavobacteriaceae bacterium]
MRYFIELSYNGKNYHGWQRQPNEVSVQEKIEEGLSLLLSETISVVGCGRTDSGVHASQFYLHFDSSTKVDEENLKFKLNAFLPESIAIIAMFMVEDGVHARFDALSRSYEYRVSLGKNPFLIDTTWQVLNKNFDIEKMNEAAKILYNYQNFKCFSRSKTDVKTYNCTITNAIWIKEENLLIFQITANRFLRNMVRAIVGTILNIGTNKISIDDFNRIIESKDRTKAGASAKAKGLFLTQITYPKTVFKYINDKTR